MLTRQHESLGHIHYGPDGIAFTLMELHMHAADHIKQGKKDLRRDPKRDMAVILSETDNEEVVMNVDREAGILTIFILERQEASETQKRKVEEFDSDPENRTSRATQFFYDEDNKEAILVVVNGNRRYIVTFKVKGVKVEIW